MAFGAIAAFVAVYLLGAGLLAGLLIYSLGGALATVTVAWFRFRCVERHERDCDHHQTLIAAE